jgi:REP element-mobilizing transposase RayT
MRQPRSTYRGAFHHCMNRGHGGEAILAGDERKRVFLDLLGEKAIKYHLRLFAYCLMDNHYHLVLQNASGRMSDFFRNLSTQYAFFYRKTAGGRGYVFQDRFHSTIIADDEYLKMAIMYVLQNPQRAGLVKSGQTYPWSSANLYVEKRRREWLDTDFVLELFGGSRGFANAYGIEALEKLPVLATTFGPVLGEENFFKRALKKFDRRKEPDAVKKRRHDDYDFDPIKKVIREFEGKHGIKVDDLETNRHVDKKLRAELMVRLRDLAGLTYREISEWELFADLQYGSLRQIYQNARRKFYGK